MATLQETKSQLALRQSQISSQKQKVSQYEQSIPKVTQQQLRGQMGRGKTINPLKALLQRKIFKKAREKVSRAKQGLTQYEKELGEYNKQLESYQASDPGKLQYAKEYGIEPKPIYGKLAKGYETQVLGYEYETPYGKVTDWSPKEKQLATEAKLLGTYSAQEAQQYFSPEIERGLTQSGIAFERDQSGQLLLKDVPQAKKSISFSTLFGRQNLQFKPTSMQEKQVYDSQIGPIQDIVNDEKMTVNATTTAPSVWGGKMFSMVSAQPNSSNNTLNTSMSTKSYDVNVSTGKSNRFLSNTLARVKSFVGSSSDYKKGYQDEIYNPKLGGFVQAERTSGQFLSTTPEVRMANMQESQEINRANYLGSFSGLSAEIPAFANRQIDKLREIPAIKNIRESNIRESIASGVNKTNQWEFPKKIFKRIPEDERPFYSPEKIKGGYDWLAEKTLQAGEFIGRNIEKSYYSKPNPFTIKSEPSGQATAFYDPEFQAPKKESAWFKPGPLSREQAKELISGAYMFASLEPFMRTGTAQMQSTYDQSVIYQEAQRIAKEKGISVNQALRELQQEGIYRYLNKPEKSGKTINIDLSYSTKAERVNYLLKNLKNKQDPSSIKEVLEIAKSQYGENFVKEFVAQEGIGGIAISQMPKVASKVKPVENMFSKTSGVELKGLSEIETSIQAQNVYSESRYAGTGQYERTESIQFNKQFQDPLSSQRMFQGVGSLSINRQRTKQETQQRQRQFQDPLLKQFQRTDLRSEQLTEQGLRQGIKQITKPRQRVDQSLTVRPRIVRPQIPNPQRPERGERIKPFALGDNRRRKISNIKRRGSDEEFLAITRRRGREVIVGKALTPQKAAAIARASALGTLGATAKVKTKSGKQIKLSPDKLFRTSKTDPLAIVQRKTAGSGRLSSRGEKLEIKLAKKGGGIFKIL